MRNKKDELIIEFRDYLEEFIKRYKTHIYLSLIDISHHLTVVRTFDKELKKLNKKKKKLNNNENNTWRIVKK